MNQLNSFLFKLSSKEIDAVCDDLILLEEGFNFFYIVDSFDFVHFFFPYTQKIEPTEELLNNIAQEAIAYESFFSNSKSGTIILLNEYKREILNVRNVYFQKVKMALELSQNLQTTATEILDLLENKEKLTEAIGKNYELFFLGLILSKRKDHIQGTSFLQFLKKQVHISGIETDDEDFDLFVNNSLRAPFINGFVEKIYHEFVERAFSFLKKFPPQKLEKYLQNTFNDIEAIHRTMNANESVYKSTNYQKNIFYYLSSTPFKSRKLFESIEKNYKDQFSFSSLFEYSSTTIHRNIFQFFLYNEFAQDIASIRTKAIPTLQALKRIIETGVDEIGSWQIPNIPNSNNAQIGEVEDSLNELLNKYLAQIDNHFYNGIIDNYKDTLRKLIGDKESIYKDIMIKFGDFLQSQDLETSTSDIGYNISKYNHLEALYKAVLDSNDNPFTIRINFRTNDVIRFNFHHLPYLLFLYDNTIHDKYDLLYSAMIEISAIDHEEENGNIVIIPFLRKLLQNHAKAVDERILESLILVYVDFLIVNDAEKFPGQSIEMELIEFLERQLEVLKFIEKSPVNPYKRSRSKTFSTPLSNEVKYILLYLYRRNICFDRIAKIEASLEHLETKDPRLHHGLALGYISNYYYQRTEKDTELLIKAINFLEIAFNEYNIFLTRIRSHKVLDLVYRNLIGVCNSICNSCNELFRTVNDKIYIIKSRYYLSSMKNYCEQIGQNGDEFPILNNTEAWLECFESEILYTEKELGLAKKKLSYATKRFKKSVYKKSFMQEHFISELESKIAELNNLLRK